MSMLTRILTWMSILTRHPYLEVQINEDPYLYYVQINDDSLPGHHVGGRGKRADYTTDTMCVVFNAWLRVTIHPSNTKLQCR